MKKLFFTLLSFFSLAVNAADFVVNGIAYNALSLTDLTCEVTNNSTPYSGNIIIPETVSYKNRTFTVIGIGKDAFSGCGDVTSLVLSNTLTYIGSNAFYGCRKLTSLSIPGTVTSIESGAVAYSGIKKLRLEDGNSTLRIAAYSEGVHFYSSFYCNNIDTLYLGRNLTGGGGKSGFFETNVYSEYKNTLSEITIGQCVTIIPSHVFWCSKAKKIVIPSSVTKIQDDAFDGCHYEELIFENGDTPIELGIHVYEDWSLKKIEYCVMHNYSLKNLYIGRDIKLAQVGSQGSTNYDYVHGFYNLSSLKNVTIGENVTELPNHLFRDCNGIEKIVLPKKLSNLNGALVGCTGIMDITCQSTIPPSVTSSSFTNNQYLNAAVQVTEDAYDTYKANEVWGQFWGLTKTSSSEIETKKCNKPTINYSYGKLSFHCDTEGAEYHSTITDLDIASYNTNEVQLDVTYNISVYATKAGYENSDVATATLCWIDVEPKTEGLVDDIAQVRAKAILIQSMDGQIVLSGIDDGTRIYAYKVNGQQVGSAISHNGQANLTTNLKPGSIVIIKIGERSVKAIIK